MWFLFAPLGKPNRFSSILGNYWKGATHRHSSQSTRRWTEEQDHKLISLFQRGLKVAQIAKELDGHSINSCRWRLSALKGGLRAPVDGEPDRRRRWTPEEDALLQEKRQQGLSVTDIASHSSSDRSYSSVAKRLQRLSTWPVSRRHISDFTGEDLQRVIEMRLKEAKTNEEIAHEMQCAPETAVNLWRYRCRRLISKETRDSIYWQTKWTPNEEEHLLELQRRGTMTCPDAALHFPCRTTSSVRHKIGCHGLAFLRLRRPSRPSTTLPSNRSEWRSRKLQG